MVARVDPRPGSKETVREPVLDPACGAHGFRTAAIVHFEKQLDTHFGPGDRSLFSFVDATTLSGKWIGSSRSALGRGADRAPSAF
jgi:hypothetical protein